MQRAHCCTVSSVVSSILWSGPNVVDRKIVNSDRPEALSSVPFSRSALLKIVRSSSAVSSEKKRWNIEKVTRPIEWATTSSNACDAQAITDSVDAANTRPTNTSQMKSGQGRIRWSLGRGGSSMSPARRLAVAETDRLEDGRREVDPQRLQRQERHAAEDVEDARSQERADEAEQARHLEADVAQEVVVQRAAPLDRLHDRREVVVGQDHDRGLLRDLGAGDPHRHADVGALQRRRVVHAVARHRDDVALAAEDVDEVDLVLGRDPRDDADLVDPRVGLIVAPRRELRAGDRAALEPELARRSPRR